MVSKAFLTLLLSFYIRLQASALTFEVSPTSLKHSGSFVTLTWKNLSSPSDSDWIGVYNPAGSNDDLFIGYVSLTIDKDWVNGSGEWMLSLINMREPYQFRLFRGNEAWNATLQKQDLCLRDTSHRVSVSENVYFENFNEPTQVHLSLTSANEKMIVMFVTRDSIKSFVRYGLNDDQLDFLKESSSLTLVVLTCVTIQQIVVTAGESQATCILWLWKIWILASYIPIRWEVTKVDGANCFTLCHMMLMPVRHMHSFLETAPYGTCLWTQAESHNTVKWLAKDLAELGQKPSFISHIGDISYARGYAWLWDLFFTQIEPLASQVPYHVCIGNHEYDWPLQPWKPSWAEQVYGKDGGGECGVPYSLRFVMPGNSSLPTGAGTSVTKNLYYSLDFGVVHFLYISTETDFLASSDQYNFIIQDLESVDRVKTPFVVVLGHRPMYSTEYTSTLISKLREHLEPLLVKYKVDLALWGHVHKYERTCAIENFVCANSTSGGVAPVHVVIGMGGQDWQPHWMSSPEHPNDPIYPQPEWSLFRSGELGYTRLYANKDLLTLSYVGNYDGQVHDSVTINSSFGVTTKRSQTKIIGNRLLLVGFWLFGICCFMLGMGFGFAMTYCFLLRAAKKYRDWMPIRNNEDGL